MNGIIAIPSSHSVEATVDKLKDLLQAKSITVFAVIESLASNAGK
jgi:hypothetical protein